MTAVTDATAFDVIVIGSGIGGLACALALSRSGRKVLVLEQHFVCRTRRFTCHRWEWSTTPCIFPRVSRCCFPASRAALEAYFSAVEDAAQLPKKTSPGSTSAREFRVILLCPTVLFGAS